MDKLKSSGRESESGIVKRHKLILDILQREGSLSVGLLSEQLKVSEVTIRKDLTILERNNKLYRSHGKAILIRPYINNRHISEKEKLNVSEKVAIGKYAASIIENSDSIVIASGSTVVEFARCIDRIQPLTVITASTQVTSALSQNENTEVIQLGGIVRKTSLSVVGNLALTQMQQFSCSKLFIGVDGVDLDFGLTTTNVMEASLNRAMIESSQKRIVLADSSKFGRRGFSKICNITDIDQIITDSGIPEHALSRLRELGIDVVVVKIG